VIVFRFLVLLTLLLGGCSGGTSGPAREPDPPTDSASAGESTPPISPTALSSTPSASAPEDTVLTGDGLEVEGRPLPFGTTYEEAIRPLTAALGEPSLDTGQISPFSVYGTCPGTFLRALEYADGAAVLLFGDVAGPGQQFYAWNLRSQGAPQEAPRVRALVGDLSTVELGIGTSVAQLRAGAAADTLDVFEGEEVFGPGFRLSDQSGGLNGSVTEASDAGTVTFITGGFGCGE